MKLMDSLFLTLGICFFVMPPRKHIILHHGFRENKVVDDTSCYHLIVYLCIVIVLCSLQHVIVSVQHV